MPFRDAHHVTGSAVKAAETRGVDLAELALADLQAIEPRITSDIYTVLTPAASAASRTSYGGTAPAQVRAQIARWKELLG
jgi:argininosuccinate lyase